ncbi:MAG: DUF1653 domain-containing protein [Stomatobaculum sp.]|nr:DUF1653 domain-containing protein [Stomatobaculum sp.]
MEKRDIPRPGEFYRHFKNRLYQIIAVACDAETEEQVVVYQALYGDYRIWVRPLENFLSRTDREKYPEAAQEWRFERVLPGASAQTAAASPAESAQTAAASSAESAQTAAASSAESAEAAAAPVPAEQAASASEVLLAFLDAETREEKKAVLVSGMGRLTQRELDSIYMALDMPAQEGDVRTQVQGILSWMKTQERYESNRLRDGRNGIITRRV